MFSAGPLIALKIAEVYQMAIMLDYRIQFLFAFLILLVILLIYPVRAETAGMNTDRIQTCESAEGEYEMLMSRPGRHLNMNRLHGLSSRKKDSDAFFPGDLFKLVKIDMGSSAAEPVFSREAENGPVNDFTDGFRSMTNPIIEISYSLSRRIALEFTGRFSHHTSMTSQLSGNKNNLYGYTLMVGPSINVGRIGETAQMYTSFGLGYNFIDTDSYTLPGDGPSTPGTGLSLGLKTASADIRVGMNHFRSLNSHELHQYAHDTTLDPSMMFFIITYNFDS